MSPCELCDGEARQSCLVAKHARYRTLLASGGHWPETIKQRCAEHNGHQAAAVERQARAAEVPEAESGNPLTTFARAAGRRVASGFKNVSPEVEAARLAVCRSGAGLTPDQTTSGHCDRYDAAGDRCSQCKCKLAGHVLAKARWASEDCPLGRWPPIASP